MVTKQPRLPTFTGHLREWLKLFKISQAELARRMGVTRPTINRYCNQEEQQRLRPEVLVDIGQALGIPPDAIFHSPAEFLKEQLDNMMLSHIAASAKYKTLRRKKRREKK